MKLSEIVDRLKVIPRLLENNMLKHLPYFYADGVEVVLGEDGYYYLRRGYVKLLRYLKEHQDADVKQYNVKLGNTEEYEEVQALPNRKKDNSQAPQEATG